MQSKLTPTMVENRPPLAPARYREESPFTPTNQHQCHIKDSYGYQVATVCDAASLRADKHADGRWCRSSPTPALTKQPTASHRTCYHYFGPYYWPWFDFNVIVHIGGMPIASFMYGASWLICCWDAI